MKVCERCEESESSVECQECAEKDGPSVAFCNECSLLIHAKGRLKKHKLVSQCIKEKRSDLEQVLKNIQRKQKKISNKTEEINRCRIQILEGVTIAERNIRVTIIEMQKKLKQQAGAISKELHNNAEKRKLILHDSENYLKGQQQKLKKVEEVLLQHLNKNDAEFHQELNAVRTLASDSISQEPIEIKLPNIELQFVLDYQPVTDSINQLAPVFPSVEESSSGGEENKLYDFPPIEENSELMCNISSLAKDGTMWMLPEINEEAYQILMNISNMIRKLYIQEDSIETLEESGLMPEEGNAVYARNPIDKKWYRGIIEDSKSMKGYANIRFVDWSTISRIALKDIIPAKEDLFSHIRPWSIQATLFEEEFMVSQDARWLFSDLTKERLVKCQLQKKIQLGDKEVIYAIILTPDENNETYREINNVIKQSIDLPGTKTSAIVSRDIRIEMDPTIERVQHIIKKSDKPEPVDNVTEVKENGSIAQTDIAVLRPSKAQLDLLAESENQNNQNKAVAIPPEQAQTKDTQDVAANNTTDIKKEPAIIVISISDSDEDIKYSGSDASPGPPNVMAPRFPTIEISDSDSSPSENSDPIERQEKSVDISNIAIREPTIEIPEALDGISADKEEMKHSDDPTAEVKSDIHLKDVSDETVQCDTLVNENPRENIDLECDAPAVEKIDIQEEQETDISPDLPHKDIDCKKDEQDKAVCQQSEECIIEQTEGTKDRVDSCEKILTLDEVEEKCVTENQEKDIQEAENSEKSEVDDNIFEVDEGVVDVDGGEIGQDHQLQKNEGNKNQAAGDIMSDEQVDNLKSDSGYVIPSGAGDITTTKDNLVISTSENWDEVGQVSKAAEEYQQEAKNDEQSKEIKEVVQNTTPEDNLVIYTSEIWDQSEQVPKAAEETENPQEAENDEQSEEIKEVVQNSDHFHTSEEVLCSGEIHQISESDECSTNVAESSAEILQKTEDIKCPKENLESSAEILPKTSGVVCPKEIPKSLKENVQFSEKVDLSQDELSVKLPDKNSLMEQSDGRPNLEKSKEQLSSSDGGKIDKNEERRDSFHKSDRDAKTSEMKKVVKQSGKLQSTMPQVENAETPTARPIRRAKHSPTSVENENPNMKKSSEFLPSATLEKGSTFMGFVIGTLNEDGNFWIGLARDEKQEIAYQHFIGSFGEIFKYSPSCENLRKGEIVLARTGPTDFYRAKVKSHITSTTSRKKVVVSLFDIGKIEEFLCTNLRRGHPSLTEPPEQAVRCSIATEQGHKFSDEAIAYFAQLTNEKLLKVTVVTPSPETTLVSLEDFTGNANLSALLHQKFPYIQRRDSPVLVQESSGSPPISMTHTLQKAQPPTTMMQPRPQRQIHQGVPSSPSGHVVVMDQQGRAVPPQQYSSPQAVPPSVQALFEMRPCGPPVTMSPGYGAPRGVGFGCPQQMTEPIDVGVWNSSEDSSRNSESPKSQPEHIGSWHGSNKSMPQRNCFTCNDPNHLARNCPQNPPRGAGRDRYERGHRGGKPFRKSSYGRQREYGGREYSSYNQQSNPDAQSQSSNPTARSQPEPEPDW